MCVIVKAFFAAILALAVLLAVAESYIPQLSEMVPKDERRVSIAD